MLLDLTIIATMFSAWQLVVNLKLLNSLEKKTRSLQQHLMLNGSFL